MNYLGVVTVSMAKKRNAAKEQPSDVQSPQTKLKKVAKAAKTADTANDVTPSPTEMSLKERENHKAALLYLQQWSSDRSQWKFQKVRQTVRARMNLTCTAS